MALSGSVSTTDYQGRYIKLSWTATQSTSKNQSTISWTVEGAGDASSSYYRAGPFYVNVAGKELESTTRINLYKGTRISGCEGSTTITHNAEGKASFTISVKAAIYDADYNCSGSKKFTLDTIPRKATITEASGFNDESNTTIKYSNPAGGTLQTAIYNADASKAIISYRACSGSSYTYSFTAAERTALQNACLTANSTNVRIYLKTTLGSNTFYHYKTVKLSIINCDPTIAPTATEEQDDNGIKNTAATGSNMRWVEGYSDIAYAFNPTFKKGATLKSCSVACGSPFEDNKTSGVLYNVNGDQVIFSLTDSRGNTVSKTITGALVEGYFKPTINITASGELVSDTMAKITLTVKGTYFKGQIKSGVNNALTFQYRHKAGTNGSWGAWTALTGGSYSNGSFNFTKVMGENFDYNLAHTFQVRVQDNFYLAHGSWIESNEPVVKIMPVFDWSETDFNFNVPITVNGLNLSGAAKALSNVYTLTTSNTAGTGWTVNSFTAVLIGNNLRCYFDWTRSSATGSGNLTNEKVASVKIKHDGKIKALYAGSVVSGSTGSVATYAISNADRDDTYVEFDINLAATASALTSSTGHFVCPVSIDLSKY